MRPLRYSINITLDGCCDHSAGVPHEEMHRHATETLAQADALLVDEDTVHQISAGPQEFLALADMFRNEGPISFNTDGSYFTTAAEPN